jgi:serine/threonine protein phosphatase 1
MRAKRRFTLAHDLEIGVVTRHVGRGPATKDPPVPIALDRRSYALPRAGADDVEIFAVGDIHGRSDLLAALLDEAARQPRQASRRVVVLLGDLVDRGPDSLGAIDIGLDGARRAGGDETIALMGNHEAMMRLALDPQTPPADAIDALETWIANGGDHTLGEFVHFTTTPADLEDLLRDARESLPPRVGDWLANLKSHWRSGGLLFVHAGVNPGVDLESFLAEPWNAPLATLGGDQHWAWVRRPFLSAAPGPQGYGGYFVVHGHTPNDLRPDPSPIDQIRRFRLNLDSGSVMTGVATMAIFRGASAEVVTASGPPGWATGR